MAVKLKRLGSGGLEKVVDRRQFNDGGLEIVAVCQRLQNGG